MKETKKTTDALELVDARRRKFLRGMLAGGAAVAALPAMSTVALAQVGGGKGKGGKGKGAGGKGKGGPGGKGRPGEGDRPSPEQLAARMIERHDKDDAGKLNAEELTAALTEMMSRRGGQGGPGGAGQGKGKGKGKGRPGGNAPGGGVRPRRPETE